MNQYPPQPPYGYPPAPPGYPPQQGYPGAAPGYPPPQPAYEFNDEHNKVFSGASTWLMVVGVIEALEAASNYFQNSNAGVGAHVITALLLFTAAGAFKKIVQTQGNDVPQLMKALDSLSNVFLVRIILFTIAAVVLGLIFGLVAVVLGAASTH